MSNSDRYDTIKKEFPELLRSKMTNVTEACRAAGIHRATYYEWYKSDPIFAAECNEACEAIKDNVESVLYHKIFKDKDTTCLIFFCKTKMKDRGYVERQETTGKDGGAIEVAQTPLQARNLELMKKAVGA